jgi:phosphomannomutase/phosphoglucomutase
MNVSRTIFREYDIRGIVGDDLTADVAEAVGRAYGSRLRRSAKKESPCVAVGYDNRPSSPDLADALSTGLRGVGANVRLLGTVPTPALYYGARVLETDGGIQITGSHNPPEYNGIKMIVGDRSVYGNEIQAIRELIEAGAYDHGRGDRREIQILDRYASEIARRADVRGTVHMVLDCGNGTGSVVAPRALEEAGIDVECLYCESDGTFPNHHPDPTVDENVVDLIRRVKDSGAALGVGLDGDADRIGAVTERGDIVRGDHLLLLYALDVLPEHPGAEVVFDVKCSKALPELIALAGGIPVMWKTGHSLIKERMKASGSPVAGEMSGHICFADKYFGFDDAIYAAARLAGLVQRSGKPFSELAAAIPAYPSTPELRVDCPEESKFDVVARAVEHYRSHRPVNDIDGARIEFEDGWALIRASNTQPIIVLRFEADTVAGLREVRNDVAAYLGELGVAVPELRSDGGSHA